MRLILWAIFCYGERDMVIYCLVVWFMGDRVSIHVVVVGKGEQANDHAAYSKGASALTLAHLQSEERERENGQKMKRNDTKQTGQIAYVLQCVGIKRTVRYITFYEITMI